MLSFSYIVLILITMLLPLTGADNSITTYSDSSIAEGDHIARPGCPHKCGNVTVPFPFGIGPGCYFDRFFEIECDASFNPPVASLTFDELRVLDISDAKILVKSDFADTCYNNSGNMSGGHSYVTSFSHNNYTFLVSDISHNLSFDTHHLSFDNITMEMGPVDIEWAIGNKNCSQQDVLCQQESFCVDSGIALGGYRCNCSQGFYGNPYLSPGCQDINECESDPCVATATCTNLPGSYNCSCNGDQNFGDGRKNGIGCYHISSPTRRLYIGLPIGFGAFSALLLSFGLFKLLKERASRKHKEKLFQRNGGLLLQRPKSVNDHVMEKLRIFTSKELEKATDLSNESRIFGKGGQGTGTVYKDMLSGGRKMVAVKNSKQLHEFQLEEFINEVVILSQINDRTIFKLRGCCLETEVPALVDKFISNGTVFDLIHDDGRNVPFSWSMRLRITAEVANALAYLHYASSIPIYLGGMKTTNILLDENYIAKLADFGLSRSVSTDQAHLTTKVKGTFGYLDPEYFRTSKFTEKSDVYSSGVVHVELLTGQKSMSTSMTGIERSLCLNIHETRRPCIKEVARELDSIRVCEFINERNLSVRVLS